MGFWFFRTLPHGPQKVHRPWLCKLGCASASDEVTAADASGLFQRLEHRVDGRKSARQLFRQDGLTGNNTLPGEKLARLRSQPFGSGRGWANHLAHEGPASRRLYRNGRRAQEQLGPGM